MLILYIIIGTLLIGIIPGFFMMGRATKKITDGILKKPDCSDIDERDISGTQYEELYDIIKKDFEITKQLDNEIVDIKSFDGLTLKARYYKVQGSKKVFLLVHGFNTTILNNFSGVINYYHERGYNVLAVSQRGHELSEGEYTTMGGLEYRDILSWIDYLDNTDNEEIYCYGISMGALSTAKASSLIKSNKVKGLIIEAGFTSCYDVMYFLLSKTKAPKNLLLKLMEKRYKELFGISIKESSLDSLKNNKIPTLFIHGLADTMVPVEHSKNAYDACGSEKELLLVEDCEHAVCSIKKREIVFNKINNFINK